MRINLKVFRLTHSAPAAPPRAEICMMPPGRVSTSPHAIPPGVLSAYPLTPISPSRNTPSNTGDPDRNGGQEMSRPPNDRTSRSASANSTTRRTRPRVPYLPQPSDVPINPDSPVSEQAAGLIHEFIHPHHHHSEEDLLAAEEELDETGSDAPIIAKELEEMRSRVWWRRPSALWYALNVSASSQLYAIRGRLWQS